MWPSHYQVNPVHWFTTITPPHETRRSLGYVGHCPNNRSHKRPEIGIAKGDCLGLFLTLDALLVREALARNADKASIAKGFAGTLVLTMVVFFLLMPRTVVAWPSGMSLLGGDRSTSDALRHLVSEMDTELAQVRHRTDLAYRRAFGAVLVSAGTVGLWLLILNSAEPASHAIHT